MKTSISSYSFQRAINSGADTQLSIIAKAKGAKISYGPAKLAMCLMLFLGIKGACIAVGVAVVLGVIFALVCKSKKRKIALAPAISLGVIAAFLAKDALLLLGVA